MSKASLAQTGDAVLRVPKPVADSVLRILGGSAVGFGMRAGMLIRSHAKLLTQSRTNPDGFHRSALLLYVLITQLMGADKRLPSNQVCVAMKTLAGWLGISPRQAAAHVQALTRSGMLPLLEVKPGQPGRASRFTFVANPFALDAVQQQQTVDTRQRRQRRTVVDQAATMEAQAAGVLEAGEATQRLKSSQQRREWALVTRRRVVVEEAAAGATGAARVELPAVPRLTPKRATRRTKSERTPAEAFLARQLGEAAADARRQQRAAFEDTLQAVPVARGVQ